MNRLITIFALFGWLALATPAWAQPFMGGGTAFDPEVGVVESGALLEAQATVSADRKYVTITTGATNTRLRDLVLFPVQVTDFGGASGFVGGVGGGGAAGVGAGAGAAASSGTTGINSSPTAISNQNSILNREGMFLLVRL
jgi:hypothetical protein